MLYRKSVGALILLSPPLLFLDALLLGVGDPGMEPGTMPDTVAESLLKTDGEVGELTIGC
jgi:hypothetical protein